MYYIVIAYFHRSCVWLDKDKNVIMRRTEPLSNSEVNKIIQGTKGYKVKILEDRILIKSNVTIIENRQFTVEKGIEDATNNCDCGLIYGKEAFKEHKVEDFKLLNL